MDDSLSTLEKALLLDRDGCSQEDADLAFRLYHQAFSEGDMKAAMVLGYLYENGIYCKQDLARSKNYYQKSSESGEPFAIFSLGRLLMDTQHREQGLELLRDAADCGYSDAFVFLGKIYEEGTLVEHNSFLAKQYFQEAAELGNNVGRQRAAGYLREGDEREYGLAIRYLELGCEENDPYCCWRLAVTILNRKGFSERVRDLAIKSQNLGVKEAKEWLEAFS